MERIDYLIENVLIVTMDDHRVINNGFLSVKDGKIHSINEFRPKVEAKESIDGSYKIAFPGFINTHTHLPMTYFRGLADDLPLDKWLFDHIFPAEQKMVNEDFVYASALHGAAEMVKNGITMVNDMYFYGESIANACVDIGLRALLGEGFLDIPGQNGKNPLDSLNFAVSQNQKYKDNELIDFAINTHSIYTISTKTLQIAAEIARMNDMPLHIHLSETKKEVDDCLKNHNELPVRYLEKIGYFTTKVLMAHGVWVSEEEMKILEKYDSHILLTTESNLKLASGLAPVKKYVDHEINLTIGTDGVASNNNVDFIGEVSTVAKLQKALNHDPTFMPAYEVLKMATVNGAEALNKKGVTGMLREGFSADFILLDYCNLENLPMYNPYSAIVYNLTNKSVTDVFILGEPVVRNSKLAKVDENEIIERALFYNDKILKI